MELYCFLQRAFAAFVQCYKKRERTKIVKHEPGSESPTDVTEREEGAFGQRVGIITPYKRQAALIRRCLRETAGKGGEGVEVATVDSFQGREKEFVIFSCVRAFPPQRSRGTIGFLKDEVCVEQHCV